MRPITWELAGVHKEPYFDWLWAVLTDGREGGLDLPSRRLATGRRKALQQRFKAWMASKYPPGLPGRWMASNCVPAAGRWTADVHHVGGTGRPCGLIYCPWCWVRKARRFENMLLRGESGKHALFWERPSRRVRGAGMSELVDMTVFETMGDLLDVPEEMETAYFDDFMKRCKSTIRSGLALKKDLVIPTGKPDFQRALRITSVVTHATSARIRTCYIYRMSSKSWKAERGEDSAIELVSSSPSGSLLMTRVRGLSLFNTVLRSSPFPKHIYSMDLSDIVRLVNLTHHRRSYALIGYSPEDVTDRGRRIIGSSRRELPLGNN